METKSLAALVFAVLLCLNTNGQTSFQKTFGESGDDYAYFMQQTADEGYVIIGYTESFGAGGQDVYLINTDSLGDILWTKAYGGTGDEIGNSVQQTFDGGYIITGETSSFGAGGADVYLIKTNSSGDTLWTKAYGGTGVDAGYSVRQTADTGYIITGYTESFGAGTADSYLIKTNSTGDTLWTKTYGGSGFEYSYTVQQTTDGGYILSGETYGFGAGPSDVYLIRTDSIGNTLWTKTYGGSGYEGGWSVQQTTDNGYIVAGWADSFGAGSVDAFLIRTDSNGDTVWTKTYGGTGIDVGLQVQETSDNGFILSGYTFSFGAGGGDAYLIKTDANGNISWSNAYGGTVGDAGYSVRQTLDGNYIVGGYSFSIGAGNADVYLIRADASGNGGGCLQSSTATITTNPSTIVGTAATITGYGGTAANTGTGVSNPVAIDSMLCISTVIQERNAPLKKTLLYPNPTVGAFHIDGSITDVDEVIIRNYMGQVLSRYSSLHEEMDISNQPAGIYFISIKNRTEVITLKIIKS